MAEKSENTKKTSSVEQTIQEPEYTAEELAAASEIGRASCRERV